MQTKQLFGVRVYVMFFNFFLVLIKSGISNQNICWPLLMITWLQLQDHLSQAIIRLQMKPTLSCEFFLLKPTAYYMNI